MAEFFDRYQQFKDNGQVKNVPFIKIPEKSTDKRIIYKEGFTRFDKLSQEFYNNPTSGFLIMLANPQFGGLEFDIPDGTIIRIPFGFKETIEQYFKDVDDFLKL
ncbi:hypothetical protein COB55_03515 [Candidatus Wolfebacteria bacterium]|nr:MAG: hypothetical protein COB55_03515 [Candidatus Wolfebacteria bacterium]